MGKRVVLIALLIVGLLASGFVAVQRYRAESRNKAVEIVVDWDEVQQIAAATGKSPADVLKRFKAAGVTSVAITQETLKDAIQNGDGIVTRNGATGSQEIFFGTGFERAPATLDAILSVQGGRAPKFTIDPDVGTRMVNAGRLPLGVLGQFPIGLPSQGFWDARKAGLGIVARLVSYPGATPKAIQFMMTEAKDYGAKTIVFQGDTVLGFKGAVEATADALRANDLYFGRIEFSKQKGDDNLAEKASDRVIIVHSITQAEMPALSEPSIVDRFQKGVRERGVRMCYVRMYFTASDDLVGDNADYISEIAKSITKAGYTLTSAHLLGEVEAPRAVRALAGVGVAAGVMLLILTVVEAPGFVLPVLLVVLCAGLAASGEMGRKAVALLSAVTFPTLAALRATSNTPETPTPAPNVVWHAIRRLICAVLTTAAGGLLIVGLLSQRDFMLRTDQFMGVKLAHLLPVLALALLYAGGLGFGAGGAGFGNPTPGSNPTPGLPPSFKAAKERFWKSIRGLASNPVLMWQALGMLVAAAIVGLMVLRSGNDSGVGVSGLELRFRSILDKVLFVRPRTKEFLIGYPALLAGIAFALRGRRQYAAPLVVVGSVGLVSALNTFCHIHTPLPLSILRVFNGAVVGMLFGIVAYWLVKNLPGKEQ